MSKTYDAHWGKTVPAFSDPKGDSVTPRSAWEYRVEVGCLHSRLKGRIMGLTECASDPTFLQSTRDSCKGELRALERVMADFLDLFPEFAPKEVTEDSTS